MLAARGGGHSSVWSNGYVKLIGTIVFSILVTGGVYKNGRGYVFHETMNGRG